MKRLIPLALLAAVSPSCSSTSEDQETARGAFESWIRATVEGDADLNFAMLSTANKSEWLFNRLQDADPIVRSWRGELSGAARTDLDLWWEFCKKNPEPRTHLLPGTVLGNPALSALYRAYFNRELDVVKSEMSRVQILQVYEDQRGVTISTQLRGTTVLYGMIPEFGGWKINSRKVMQ